VLVVDGCARSPRHARRICWRGASEDGRLRPPAAGPGGERSRDLVEGEPDCVQEEHAPPPGMDGVEGADGLEHEHSVLDALFGDRVVRGGLVVDGRGAPVAPVQADGLADGDPHEPAQDGLAARLAAEELRPGECAGVVEVGVARVDDAADRTAQPGRVGREEAALVAGESALCCGRLFAREARGVVDAGLGHAPRPAAGRRGRQGESRQGPRSGASAGALRAPVRGCSSRGTSSPRIYDRGLAPAVSRTFSRSQASLTGPRFASASGYARGMNPCKTGAVREPHAGCDETQLPTSGPRRRTTREENAASSLLPGR
jgi:hypothetical protein